MKTDPPYGSASGSPYQEGSPQDGQRLHIDIPQSLADISRYSCGFLFSPGLPAAQVLLISKLHTRWQFGRLNGIGGRIEYGETPVNAMRRKFLEKAGLEIESWDPVAILQNVLFEIHFFSAWTSSTVFKSARAMTDEPLETILVDNLHQGDLIPNLRILIPLALDRSGIVKPVLFHEDTPQTH